MQPVKGLLQCGEVDFFHEQHGCHHAIRFGRVAGGHHLAHGSRNDLPRRAVLVFQPAALLCLRVAASRQLAPVKVDFVLRVALDLKGNRFVELENRPAIECGEALAVELERHDHHTAGLLPVHFLPGLAVVGDLRDLRVFEDARVKPCGLFGLVVKPETGNDLLESHGTYSL